MPVYQKYLRLAFFLPGGHALKAVYHLFDQKPFYIDIIAEHGDKRKKLQDFAVLFGGILKGLLRDGKLPYNVFLQVGNLILLQAEHLLVDVAKA